MTDLYGSWSPHPLLVAQRWKEREGGGRQPGECRFLEYWAGGFSLRFIFSFSPQDMMSERREKCSGGGRLPAWVDRVRDQRNQESIGTFLYIVCDQVRKCIRLPSTPYPHSIPECCIRALFCFPKRQVICGGDGKRKEVRVICSGGNSSVK